MRRYVDGERVLCVLGRLDRQVKLRGMRVELGEVEHALASAGRCAVVKRGEQLVAFTEGSADELRAEAKRMLPPHMRPATVIESSLPLLPNGKVDYATLAADREVEGPASPFPSGPAQMSNAVEEGLDSLGIMVWMSKQQKRELQLVYQVLGLLWVYYYMPRHWSFLNKKGQMSLSKHAFDLPPGLAQAWFSPTDYSGIPDMACFVLGALLHSREPGAGWYKTCIVPRNTNGNQRRQADTKWKGSWQGSGLEVYAVTVFWQAAIVPFGGWLCADLSRSRRAGRSRCSCLWAFEHGRTPRILKSDSVLSDNVYLVGNVTQESKTRR